MITVYLAGPDVFLPNAREHARRKVEICAQYGLRGQPPLNEDIESLATMESSEAGLTIFRKDVAMMEAADIIIANLTPFRGASADAGTLVEIGWFLGRGKPIFGYSNTATLFDARSRAHVSAIPDPMPHLTVEHFGLPDNLMVPGAVLAGGHPMVLPEDGMDRVFDALDVFERCVQIAALKMGVGETQA
ncbi:nucleoside 2-deoxyribosyltransferase [Acidisoma cladoniae]|uniref:nucleoside 2-deoxyribosyltransferase n=1 Tax=Acidisoma cladoniae TaxID=3040935 RepID=UPI00254EB860|nr:nucleoside 2-deoxyribosyltransferase [Acidisoma sp. PAMC 29798]